jgi:K+-sensing histidine kinase KdpD
VSSLVNLIRFAREHTSENDEIIVSISSQNGSGECLVEDGGANYSNALSDLLTEQFSAKETALNLNMGIGLAVSQMIMEAHGGRLIFEKTESGKGKLKMVFPHE